MTKPNKIKSSTNIEKNFPAINKIQVKTRTISSRHHVRTGHRWNIGQFAKKKFATANHNRIL